MATPTELVERTSELRRQEELLTDALGSGALRGEQRRVQTALLRDTRRELTLAKRAAQAVAAGWDPFVVAHDWHWGYVEDPRFLHGRPRLVSTLLALPLAVLAGVWLAGRWELLAAGATAAVLWLGLQTTLHEGLSRFAQRKDLDRLGDQNQLRIFNAPMPAYAATAYRRAQQSGLFDNFVVRSPRAEDFRQVAATEAPSLGLLDPVLVGRIGGFSFLISQWDLAKDLSS
jgi:hypothetical protein